MIILSKFLILISFVCFSVLLLGCLGQGQKPAEAGNIPDDFVVCGYNTSSLTTQKLHLAGFQGTAEFEKGSAIASCNEYSQQASITCLFNSDRSVLAFEIEKGCAIEYPAIKEDDCVQISAIINKAPTNKEAFDKVYSTAKTDPAFDISKTNEFGEETLEATKNNDFAVIFLNNGWEVNVLSSVNEKIAGCKDRSRRLEVEKNNVKMVCKLLEQATGVS